MAKNTKIQKIDYRTYEGFDELSDTVKNLIINKQLGSKMEFSKIAPEYDARAATDFMRICNLREEKRFNEQAFDLSFDHSKDTGGIYHLSEGDGVREPEIREGAGQYSTINVKELTEKDKDRAFQRNRDYLVSESYQDVPLTSDEADDCLIKVVKYSKPELWASTPKKAAVNLINMLHKQMSKRGADPVKLAGIMRHATLGNPNAMESYLRNADNKGPLKFAEANNLFRYISNFEQKFKKPAESSALHNGVLVAHLLNLTLKKGRESQSAMGDFETLSKSMTNRVLALNDAFSKYSFDRFDEETRSKIGKGLTALREIVRTSHVVIKVPDEMETLFQKGARSVKMNSFEKWAAKVESVKDNIHDRITLATHSVQTAVKNIPVAGGLLKAGMDLLNKDQYDLSVEWAGNTSQPVQTNKTANKRKP